MKLNNKGFVVSAVLYSLLIAFLMFLLAALAMFSSSNTIISAVNDDLVNDTELKAVQVKEVFADGTDVCTKGKWYNSDKLVKISSKQGIMYWPRDFGISISNGIIIGTGYKNKTITVACKDKNDPYASYKSNCDGFNLTNNNISLEIDEDFKGNAIEQTLGNICE